MHVYVHGRVMLCSYAYDDLFHMYRVNVGGIKLWKIILPVQLKENISNKLNIQILQSLIIFINPTYMHTLKYKI